MKLLAAEPEVSARPTPTSTPKSSSRTSRSRLGRTQKLERVAILIVLPAVLLVAIFFALPIVQAVRISTSSWAGFGDINFVGFGSYVAQLANPQTYKSLLITIEFALATSIGIVVLATLLATAISRGVKGGRIYRVLWFIPSVVPPAAVAVFWNTAFQPSVGTVNAVMTLFGLKGDTAWLSSPTTAIYPTIFVAIWAGVGFAFLLILGAMEQIPVSIYEAAEIDGASGGRKFFTMTLPLIRPVLAITFTLNFIWAFNNFAVVWGLTMGGPGVATTTLPVLVYRDAFVTGDYVSATTVAVFAGVVLLILGILTLRLGQTKKDKLS